MTLRCRLGYELDTILEFTHVDCASIARNLAQRPLRQCFRTVTTCGGTGSSQARNKIETISVVYTRALPVPRHGGLMLLRAVTVLVFACLTWPTVARAEDAASGGEQLGTIAGQVLDKSTGEPLIDAG